MFGISLDLGYPHPIGNRGIDYMTINSCHINKLCKGIFKNKFYGFYGTICKSWNDNNGSHICLAIVVNFVYGLAIYIGMTRTNVIPERGHSDHEGCDGWISAIYVHVSQ